MGISLSIKKHRRATPVHGAPRARGGHVTSAVLRQDVPAQQISP